MTTPLVAEPALASNGFDDLIADEFRTFAEPKPMSELERRIFDLTNGTVAGGPFKGLHYVDSCVESAFAPKLVGSYECELESAIENAIARRYSTIINVGCAEGFYAVGMAMRSPNSEIIGIDPDPRARELARQMSELNGVSQRVHLFDNWKSELSEIATHGSTLVIMDCEGGEFRYINSELLDTLRRCDLIVEVHCHWQDPQAQTLTNAFAQTHQVQMVLQGEATTSRYPVLDELSTADVHAATAENRADGHFWAILSRYPHN